MSAFWPFCPSVPPLPLATFLLPHPPTLPFSIHPPDALHLSQSPDSQIHLLTCVHLPSSALQYLYHLPLAKLSMFLSCLPAPFSCHIPATCVFSVASVWTFLPTAISFCVFTLVNKSLNCLCLPRLSAFVSSSPCCPYSPP